MRQHHQRQRPKRQTRWRRLTRATTTSLCISLLLSLVHQSQAETTFLDIVSDFGAIPNERSREVIRHNTDAFQKALRQLSSSVLRIPSNQTFHLYHGLVAKRVHDAVIQVDGKLAFERDFSETPWIDNLDGQKRHPRPFFFFLECDNITLTSNEHRGVLDGQGPQWWGFPLVGYLQLQEFRPTIMHFNTSSNILIEKLIFQDAPLYNLYMSDVNGVEIRDMSIVARRTHRDGHGLFDLSAFNTDGIDIAGHNVWVHDVDIWNQDDCIAVKDNYNGNRISSNMTFERIHASGLGFTIGSIGGSTVRNITFKDSYLYKSYKGIYLKFRDFQHDKWDNSNRTGLIEDILFQNVTMESPEQWGVWIGPAQQAIDNNPCHADPCSLCWPLVPFSKCNAVRSSKFRNITLRNVVINNPKASPGVLMGDENNRIEGMVFEDVVVMQGPPISTKMDRVRLFPGLGRSIDDPGMRQLVFVLTLLGFISLALLLCCIKTPAWVEYRFLQPNGSSTEYDDDDSTPFQRDRVADPDASHFDDLSTLTGMEADDEAAVCGCCLSQKNDTVQLKQRYRVLIVIFVAIFAILCGWLLRTSYKMRNVKQYFECRGVEGGIARGSTWPVPSCFHDETKPMIGELTFGMSLAEKFFLLFGIVCIVVVVRKGSALYEEVFSTTHTRNREDQSFISSFLYRQLPDEEYEHGNNQNSPRNPSSDDDSDGNSGDEPCHEDPQAIEDPAGTTAPTELPSTNESVPT